MVQLSQQYFDNHYLTLKISFHLLFMSAEYISNAVQTTFIMEANSINPDQTAP